MTLSASQLAAGYKMTIWCCQNCADAIKNRGDLILVGREIPNPDGDYECDICGKITNLVECMV